MLQQETQRPKRLHHLVDTPADRGSGPAFGKRQTGKMQQEKAVDPIFGKRISKKKRGSGSVSGKRQTGKQWNPQQEKAVDPIFGKQPSLKQRESMQKKLSTSEHPMWQSRDDQGPRAAARLSVSERDSVLPNSPQAGMAQPRQRGVRGARRRRLSWDGHEMTNTDDVGHNGNTSRDFAMPSRRDPSADQDPFLMMTDDIGGGGSGDDKNSFW